MKPGIQKLKRKQAGYTRVSDEFSRDPDLTPRGTRVGLYVLSHRDGFVLTQRTIGKKLKMAETTVRGALADLADRGYMRSWTVRDDRGRVEGTAFLMHDERLTPEEWEAERVAADEEDETAGQELDAESAVRDDDDETAGQALTVDSLARESLGRESVGLKGNHHYKGDHNPKGTLAAHRETPACAPQRGWTPDRRRGTRRPD